MIVPDGVSEKVEERSSVNPFLSKMGRGFYLRFDRKMKFDSEKWVLRNTADSVYSPTCVFSSCPSLCSNKSFLVPFLKNHAYYLSDTSLILKLREVRSVLNNNFEFYPPGKTLDRSWKIVLGIDMESVLRQNQQV